MEMIHHPILLHCQGYVLWITPESKMDGFTLVDALKYSTPH